MTTQAVEDRHEANGWDGSTWNKVASDMKLSSTNILTRLTPDGRGGFWLTAADPVISGASDTVEAPGTGEFRATGELVSHRSGAFKSDILATFREQNRYPCASSTVCVAQVLFSTPESRPADHPQEVCEVAMVMTAEQDLVRSARMARDVIESYRQSHVMIAGWSGQLVQAAESLARISAEGSTTADEVVELEQLARTLTATAEARLQVDRETLDHLSRELRTIVTGTRIPGIPRPEDEDWAF